jgi:hypothetical protein
MPVVLNRMPHQYIRILMARGNRTRNIGYPDLAEQKYYRPALWLIDNEIQGRTQKVRAKDAVMRRLATVEEYVSSKDMEKITNNAKDHNEQYGYLTALEIEGYNHFRNREHDRARESFLAMFEQGPGTITSWWHKMAGWLGLGSALYASNQSTYEEALSCCLKAEYTSAMLGLRVDVTKGISEQLLGPGALLSPSAVVRKIGKEQNVRKEKMVEIRRRALIKSGLQKDLLAELSGESWTRELASKRRGRSRFFRKPFHISSVVRGVLHRD